MVKPNAFTVCIFAVVICYAFIGFAEGGAKLGPRPCNYVAPEKMPPAICDSDVDLVILQDVSGSVWDKDFDKSLKFLDQLVRGLTSGLQVSLIQYSGKGQHHSVFPFKEFGTDKRKMLKAINCMERKYEYDTYTAEAMTYARENVLKETEGDRPDAIDVLVVVTDGQSKDGQLLAPEAQKLEDMDVITFALGVGGTPNATQLLEIANQDESRRFRAPNFDALGTVLAAEINENICQNVQAAEKLGKGGVKLLRNGHFQKRVRRRQ